MASEHSYVEVNCQRSLGNGQFASGLQDFVFSIGRPSVFMPSKSYFRVELSLRAGAVPPAIGLLPTIASQLALAENCVANCYNNAYFLGGGQSISQCTNFLPQASAVEYRTGQQQGWLKSIGASAFTYNSNLSSRISMVSGGTAVAGFSQDEGKDITYRPTVANFFNAASVNIIAGAVAGGNTLFTAADVGSTLVAAGQKAVITVVTNAGQVTVSPALTVDAATDWYIVRRASKITDGSIEGKNVMHVLWRPTVLGIFNYAGVLGSGDYRIQLNPDVNYKFAAVETPNTEFKNNDASGYQFEIVNVIFYAAVAKMAIPDTIERMKLTEFAVLTKNATSYDGNYQFTVPSSTRALYVAVQAGDSGSNPAHPPSRFIVGGGQELNMTSMQITYANMTKPMTRWKSGFSTSVADQQNFMTQFYYQSAIETGRASLAAGVETEAEWLSRGPYMCFRFDRDVNDRSTEVQLQLNYGPTAWDTTTKLLLIAEYTNHVEITTQGGLVVKVDKVASA
jgi:hypothetical protein